MERPRAIVLEHEQKKGERIPSSDLVVFDFSAGQVWSTSDGTLRIKIQEQKKSGRFIIVVEESAVPQPLANPYNNAQLQEFLRKNECLKKIEAPAAVIPTASDPVADPAVPAPPVMDDMGVVGAAGGAEPASATVTDIALAREQRRQDGNLSEPGQPEAQLNKVSVMTGIHEEIRGLADRCTVIQAEVESVVTQAQGFSRKGRAGQVERMQKRLGSISSEVEEKIRQGAMLVEDDDAELIRLDDAAKDGGSHIDDQVIAKKRERRDQLAAVAVALEDLLAQAQGVVASFEQLRTAEEKTPAAPEGTAIENATLAHGGNLEALPKAKESARPAPAESPAASIPDTLSATDPKGDKPKAVRKPRTKKTEEPEKEGEEKKEVGSGAPGGTKGPEGPEGPELGAVLEELRTKVSGLIETIRTPEEYGAFRREMLVIPAKEVERPARRCFFSLEDIKDLVRRKITDEEMTQVNALERELEDAARKKFFALKNADLNTQFKRERTKIDTAPDDAALVALTEAWSREPNMTNIWSAVLADLTEKERTMVAEGYQDRSERLTSYLEGRRQELRLEAAQGEWLSLLNIADPAKAREKAAFLEDFITDQYKEYVRYMQHEAKKIKPNGSISSADCWPLWQEHGGEAKLEDTVAQHLRVFHGVDSEVGKKIFRALVSEIEQKANKEA